MTAAPHNAALVAMAVANNMAWCDAVCRSRGLTPAHTSRLWTVSQPPPLYPHVITLTSDVNAHEVVEQVDSRATNWVKDSFATIDLAAHGFRPAFDASWVFHAAGSPTHEAATYSVVTSDDELALWCAATETAASIDARILSDPAVRLVIVRDAGRHVGGAAFMIVGDVVGISNVFTMEGSPDSIWPTLITVAGHLAPHRAVVGYETGTHLTASLRAGFSPSGPLRIWRRRADDPD